MAKFKDYKEANKYVKELHLRSASDWRRWSRSERPPHIPSNPSNTYKGKGWKSWSDWLGTSNVAGGNLKYSCNDDFFKIWSQDMAYVLGLWCADGYANYNSSSFCITLHKKDSYILEFILKIIGSNSRLYSHGENNELLRITSKGICKDLKGMGFRESKTFSLKFPNIPKKYLPDFIRGFWDGDGTVSKYNQGGSSSVLCASDSFVTSLLSFE